MNGSRTRSLQDLVQRMTEVNTRLGAENDPAQPEKSTMGGSPADSGVSLSRSEPPVASKPLIMPTEEPEKVHPFFELNRDNLIRGIVFAEVLGKPKARRGRMRF